MKIRHKQSGVELEGDFVRVSRSYFSMPLTIPHGGSCYAASEWEAVPEWVDVTGECGLAQLPESCVIVHNFREIDVRSGYRLRKVERNDFSAMFRHAFIVERKV